VEFGLGLIAAGKTTNIVSKGTELMKDSHQDENNLDLDAPLDDLQVGIPMTNNIN
jgi:hypothetical protein